MLVRGSWWMVVSGLLLVGCGPSLVNMSAGQIGCRPSDVSVSDVHNSFGSRNWVATCHGAEFSCSQVETGGGSTTLTTTGSGSGRSTATSSFSASQVNCSPMRAAGGVASSARASSSQGGEGTSQGAEGTSQGGAGTSKIQRGYDEGRQAHFVTGKFGVADRLHVIISGAPKLAMGTISVTLSGYADHTVRLCTALQVLINGEPVSTEQNEGAPIIGGVKIESRFDFAVFRPLAERHPVFGVRACGTTWKFTPEQVESLRALLVVYSDLAQKLQNDGDTTPVTAPGQTTL